MKEKRILNALTQVDESFIEEAASAAPAKHRDWRKWGALAACLALVVGLGIRTISIHSVVRPSHPPEVTPTASTPTEEPTPPVVTPSDVPTLNGLPILNLENLKIDGMGFEGVMYYDPEEISPYHPWSEDSVLETLPVYRNLAYTDRFPVPAFFDEDQLLRRAEAVAAALGTVIESTEYSYASQTSSPPKNPEDARVVYRIEAETPLSEIEVASNGAISIFFEPAIELPEEYSFTDQDTSDEEAQRTIAYLLDRFSALYDPEVPVIISTGGDYNIYGEQYRSYRAYDGGGDLAEQLLSYCFEGITFYPNDDGNLWILRLGNVLDGAEKIGDYPIITAQEARALLLEGSYLTTVPSEYLSGGKITEEAIVKVELTYRTNLYEPTFMPYYRFYVELDMTDSFRELPEGLKNYGVYYVPAVEGEYLSGLPSLGELRFN